MPAPEKSTKSKTTKKFQPSQLEVLGDDTSLDKLNLALAGFASEHILSSVTRADVERTIEGASTFVVDVNDVDRALMHSPFLTEDVFTEVDGLWFALAGVDKEGDTTSLTFEDREVYFLRKYDKPKTAAWGTTSRARFIRDMVREVKEVAIDFYCPEMDKDLLKSDKPDERRQPGFYFSTRIKVKGVPGDELQKEMISRVLRVGLKMKVSRRVLVAAVETITVESQARNLSGGDKDSAGLFQQRPSQGWGTYAQVTNPEHAAHSFFTRAVQAEALHPGATPGEISQLVQRSAFPERYEAWRDEAENTVTQFGVPKGQDVFSSQFAMDVAQAQANGQEPLALDLASMFISSGLGGDQYQFTRGSFSTDGSGKQTVKRENSWDCSGRLADEVNWRRFMVSGTFYYASEPFLFRSRPRLVIGSEFDDGIISINFSYDSGQKNAKVTIEALVDRWAAPPGSVVLLENLGVIDGRWLVYSISRSLFSPIATISLQKPRPKLPEPKQNTGLGALSNISLPKAKTAGLSSGFVAPLSTPGHLDRSEFMVPDAEGAPNAMGVRYHAAKDWFAPGGSPVVAPIGGTIVEVKPSQGNSGQIFGGVVKLQQSNGFVWVFRHVAPVVFLQVGQRVGQGTTLATVVRWADAPASSHCHIEVWKTLEGGYNLDNMVDPIRYLKGEV